MEQLALPQRLRDAVRVVEVRHLLVPDLGVDPHHVGVLEGGDEGQGVTGRRQQDVPARLVGLRLDGEPQVVALVDAVLGEQIQALAIALQRRLDVLGRVDLGALAAAPEHERLRAEVGGQVEIAQDLAQRVPAHAAVVAGERPVLEHRVGEGVGGDHRHDQAGLVQGVLELRDDLVATAGVATERHQVVVVERDPVRAQLGQPVHRLDRVERTSGRVAERVAGRPADRPQAEGELVVARRGEVHSRRVAGRGPSQSARIGRSAGEWVPRSWIGVGTKDWPGSSLLDRR